MEQRGETSSAHGRAARQLTRERPRALAHVARGGSLACVLARRRLGPRAQLALELRGDARAQVRGRGRGRVVSRLRRFHSLGADGEEHHGHRHHRDRGDENLDDASESAAARGSTRGLELHPSQGASSSSKPFEDAIPRADSRAHRRSELCAPRPRSLAPLRPTNTTNPLPAQQQEQPPRAPPLARSVPFCFCAPVYLPLHLFPGWASVFCALAWLLLPLLLLLPSKRGVRGSLPCTTLTSTTTVSTRGLSQQATTAR